MKNLFILTILTSLISCASHNKKERREVASATSKCSLFIDHENRATYTRDSSVIDMYHKSKELPLEEKTISKIKSIMIEKGYTLVNDVNRANLTLTYSYAGVTGYNLGGAGFTFTNEKFAQGSQADANITLNNKREAGGSLTVLSDAGFHKTRFFLKSIAGIKSKSSAGVIPTIKKLKLCKDLNI